MSYETNKARNKRRAVRNAEIARRISNQLKEFIDNESVLIKTVFNIIENMPYFTEYKSPESFYDQFKFRLIFKLPLAYDTWGLGKGSRILINDIVSKHFNNSIKSIVDRIINQKAFW